MLEFSNDIEPISCISFSGDEINCIYDIRNGIEKSSFSFDDGSVEFSLKNFADTTIDDGIVSLNNVEIQCNLSISRQVKYGIEESPLSLCSLFCLYFDETNDYMFLLDLINHVHQLLSFFCYRRNIDLSSIEFKQKVGNKYRACAKFINFKPQREKDAIKIIKDRYIPYDLVESKLHRILQDVIDGKIYLKHIPDNYSASKRITPASFLMTTAAFEGEFSRSYPEGIKKSAEKIQAQTSVREALETLTLQTTGMKRKIYKYLIKQINNDSLREKLLLALKDYSEIIEPFGKYSYAINKAEYCILDISDSISSQRNAFAHGDLSRPFIRNSSLGIGLLEFLVYAMQLSHYGIANNDIQQIIKKLFAINIII